MVLRRARRLTRFLVLACIALAWGAGISWSPAAGSPAAAVPAAVPGTAATAIPDPWPFAWRPFWIPGDPIDFHPQPLWDSWVASADPAPGLRVALDPETGLPTVPSEAQRRAAAALLEGGLPAVDDPPLPAVRLPGGGEIVHLQGRFQSYSMARRDAHGRVVIDCVSGPGPAVPNASGPPARGTRREEK